MKGRAMPRRSNSSAGAGETAVRKPAPGQPHEEDATFKFAAGDVQFAGGQNGVQQLHAAAHCSSDYGGSSETDATVSPNCCWLPIGGEPTVASAAAGRYSDGSDLLPGSRHAGRRPRHSMLCAAGGGAVFAFAVAIGLAALFVVVYGANAAYGGGGGGVRAANDRDRGSRWDLFVRTCDREGAGTDAEAYVKLYYEAGHNQQRFQLRSGHDDLERGKTDHYVLRLAQDDVIHMGLYWMPSWFGLSESWCVQWAVLLSPQLNKCYVGYYDKWILHYHDPPTYPAQFDRMDYASCIAPPAKPVRFLQA